MKEYSIKNVADLLGTTKNTIKYRMKKLPGDLVRKEGSQWFILETALDLLRDNVPSDQNGTGDHVSSDPVPDKPVPDELIRSLQDQIDFLKSQIEIKDKQIEDLSTGLKQEQGISLHNALLLKDREETILKLEADTKKSWFSRVFHRSH